MEWMRRLTRFNQNPCDCLKQNISQIGWGTCVECMGNLGKGSPPLNPFQHRHPERFVGNVDYKASCVFDESKTCHLFLLGERIVKKREYISSLEQGQTDMQLSTFMLIANALGLQFSLVVG